MMIASVTIEQSKIGHMTIPPDKNISKKLILIILSTSDVPVSYLFHHKKSITFWRDRFHTDARHQRRLHRQ